MDLFTEIFEEPSKELQEYARECGYQYDRKIVGERVHHWYLTKLSRWCEECHGSAPK